MNVFDLVAKITLDKSQYDESLGDAGKGFAGFGDKVKKGLGTAAKIGGAAIAAVGAAGVALTKTVMDGAAKTASYGDNIDKMSQKLGMSAQAYQEWDAILQHSGASIESMQGSMKTLQVAAESGNKAFQELGISQEALADMSPEEMFDATVTALQNVDDESRRTYLATQLLGRGATELGALLNTSAEDTEAMRQRVHELGGVMSDEAVKAAAAYQDSLQDMQTAFSGLSRGLFASFMPSITKVMDGLTEVFSGNSDKGIGVISDGIDELVENISDKVPEFLDLGLRIVQSLGRAIVKNLPKLMGAAGQLVGQIVAGIISALPQLIQQVPEIVRAIINGLAAAWPEIKEAGLQLLQMLWEGIQSAMEWLVENLSEIWQTIKDNMSENWQAMKDEAAREWDRIRTAISQKVDNIKSNLAQKWDNIKSTVSGKIDALRTGISTRFETIRSTIAGVVERIKGLFNFTWSLPQLKLPHIVVGSYIDVPVLGTIPDPTTLRVDWYKKAYDQPYMFSKPTVMRGFGDGNGDEMVYGKDNLMRDIRDAVGEAGPSVTINVYPQKGQNEEEIARAVQKVFVKWDRQRRAAHA